MAGAGQCWCVNLRRFQPTHVRFNWWKHVELFSQKNITRRVFNFFFFFFTKTCSERVPLTVKSYSNRFHSKSVYLTQTHRQMHRQIPNNYYIYYIRLNCHSTSPLQSLIWISTCLCVNIHICESAWLPTRLCVNIYGFLPAYVSTYIFFNLHGCQPAFVSTYMVFNLLMCHITHESICLCINIQSFQPTGQCCCANLHGEWVSTY